MYWNVNAIVKDNRSHDVTWNKRLNYITILHYKKHEETVNHK